MSDPVHINLYLLIQIWISLFIRMKQFCLQDPISPVYDIFCFVPVKMKRDHLFFLIIKNDHFFAIRHPDLRTGQISIANGKKYCADMGKITRAKICHIPPLHHIFYIFPFSFSFLPFIDSPICEIRQAKLYLIQCFHRKPDCLIHFRPFHSPPLLSVYHVSHYFNYSGIFICFPALCRNYKLIAFLTPIQFLLISQHEYALNFSRV